MIGKEKKHIITEVKKGSIAEQMDLEAGDKLLEINGTQISDIFDYHFLSNDENLTVIVQKSNGEEWELDIEKEAGEDLGLVFSSGLMDEYRSCKNKCVFCFIDQMPPGMRETLYFKDDDSRLSFLQGNYVTLTNMSDADVKRICFYKLSPINISIHTMNKNLRCSMLNNRFAGTALDKLKILYDAGIAMNGQIVLCKGYNDGKELDDTVAKLEPYIKGIQSVSVVPVGLTKYREGLTPLEGFTKEDAKGLLLQLSVWQEFFLKTYGTRFVHASDEWYLKAGQPIPKEVEYEGYPQLENGVGMVRSLINEFESFYAELPGDCISRTKSIVTGKLAKPILDDLVKRLTLKYTATEVHVYSIENVFFGSDITVAGLLTGKDIISQLKGKKLGDELLISEVMLRKDEAVFLDDTTVDEVEKALQTRTCIVQSDGASFINAMIEIHRF